MHVKKIALFSILLVGALAFFALGHSELAPVAQAAAGCDAGDLNGTFSFVLHGNNPAGQPFGAIGTFTSDGAGALDGFRVSVDNGERSSSDFTCSYAMSAGCLFRGPCVDDGEVVPEMMIDGALADGKREIELAVSGIPDAAGGAVVTGVARKW